MQITKVVTFDTGHRLTNYQGKCRNLHGHTYKLEVTVEGELDELGMVVDFGILKEIIKDVVESRFDHKTIFYKNDPINYAMASQIPKSEDWIIWVDYNPTAENIVKDISFKLEQALHKQNIKLKKVRLWETPSSFAEIELSNV